jgi:hypothetical protein
VREDLFHALEMLRATYSKPWSQEPRTLLNETRLIWIDAICINQKDVQERNHQVRIMSTIYKCAESVRVWLGGWTNEDGDAFKLMREILQALGTRPKSPGSLGMTDLSMTIVEQMELYDRNLQSAWTKVYLWYAADNKPRDIWNFGGWEALASIFERSYWTRIWIVQEYLLARKLTIHFGEYYTSGDDMEAVLTTVDRVYPELRAEFPVSFIQPVDRINNSVGKKINDMRREKQRGWEERCLPLVNLMEATRASHCQVFHDRIYAILGLATDRATFDSIPIDYDRSSSGLFSNVLTGDTMMYISLT